MTVVDEVLDALASAFGAIPGKNAITGRIVDQIGAPVAGATVRLVITGMFSGKELARATTGADGRFALDGSTCPFEYLVVAQSGSVTLTLVQTKRPPFCFDDFRLMLPLQPTAAVGDGGDNRPYDVRRLQDRLQRLGRLSAADVAAEPVDLSGTPPVAPGPRLMAALARHCAVCLGRPLPVLRVDPAGALAASLAAGPPFPPTGFALSSAVGSLPGADPSVALNAPTSFDLVQQRLNQFGLLNRADFVSEYTDAAAAGPVDTTTKPRTLAAIAAFDRNVTGGSMQAIVPGAFNERTLNDPFVFGMQPVRLSGSVGARGANAGADVLRAQDALRVLDAISDADYARERAAALAGSPDAHVADSDIPRTIAAIQALRESRLGEAAPAAGLLDPVDPALARLNRPARLELTDTVGWGPALICANRPADVRRLQDRLLLAGILSQADYDAERADPYAAGRIDQSGVPHTAVALALLSEQRVAMVLTGAVGPGQANAPGDVRSVQDRLHNLNFLADADYQRELVDFKAAAADETKLASTFDAIAKVRQKIFELPAASGSDPWTAQPVIEPEDETHSWLNDPLFYGRYPLALGESVGAAGWNFPADARALQERLRAMRFLSDADFAAEAADPASAERLGDLRLSATREAIRRFRQALLGEANRPLERVEPRSAALAALEDRFGALMATLNPSDSVGYNGRNNPADVLQVQRRLYGLGFLAAQDYELESLATPGAGQTTLRDNQISQTIQAIQSWQTSMLAAVQEPRVDLASETLYSLRWPMLPRRAQLALGGRVGRNGFNAAADVRQLQDRLYELGPLAPADYFSERVDPAAGGAIPDATIPATIAAIGLAERTWAGNPLSGPDFVVDPGGLANRVLNDPTYSTSAAPNPNCALSSAGPGVAFADADLMHIIRAIEAWEGGVSTGEVPAGLRNASGTPASWGKAQVIGDTALRTVTANAALSDFYRLTASLGPLRTRADAVINRFNAITNAVAPNTTEAALQAQIQPYVAANAAAVYGESGFAASDIERMFRVAQFRQQLAAAVAAGASAASLMDPATHPDSAANIASLGLAQSDVDVYLHNNYYNEHRQGFVTRSLFMAPEGQLLRNAMTDDNGFKLGRYVIQANWNSTAGLGLGTRQRSELTAYLHHNGGNAATLAAQMATVAADAYVVNVMNHY